MTVLQRIQREPAALLAVVAAIVPVMLLSGVPEPLAIAVSAVVVALIGLLRYVVTPASEVVAQELPSGRFVAGQASIVETGAPLKAIAVTPLGDPYQAPDGHGGDTRVEWVDPNAH